MATPEAIIATLPVSFIKEAHNYACKKWQEKIESQFPELFKETYKVGDVICITRFEEYEFMISAVGKGNITLISVGTNNTGGNFNSNTFRPGDLYSITKSEIKKFIGHQREFKLIRRF
jgi:hypothetical protein